MYYYEVFYETTPSSVQAELVEEGATDIKQIFYFGTYKKLDSDGIENALLYYLREDKKIKYKELRIYKINEISESEYNSHTQYE